MDVLAGLLPVFLLMALGVAARRWGLLPDPAAAGLNRLVANLALPALLIIKIGTASLEASFSWTLVLVTSAVLLLTTVSTLAGATLARVPTRQRGVLAQGAMRGNLAYVGFPVVLGTLGEGGLERAAVTAAVLIPLMNLVSVAVLEAFRGEAGRTSLRLALRVVVNPLVVAALGGLLLATFGWRPWRWLGGSLEILSDFALPGALLALGAQLRLGHWRRVWRPTAAAAIVKLVLQPLAAFWALRWLGVDDASLAVGVLLLAAPTAFTSYPVAAELGGDTDVAGACIVVTTAAAFVVYVGWTLVLQVP